MEHHYDAGLSVSLAVSALKAKGSRRKRWTDMLSALRVRSAFKAKGSMRKRRAAMLLAKCRSQKGRKGQDTQHLSTITPTPSQTEDSVVDRILASAPNSPVPPLITGSCINAVVADSSNVKAEIQSDREEENEGNVDNDAKKAFLSEIVSTGECEYRVRV